MRSVSVLCCLLAATVAGCTLPGPVTVMSFNIRYGTAPDGDDAWPLRRENVFDVIRTAAPDVAGLQEVLAFQADELLEALPEYDLVGVGRDDGARGGEMAPILFHRKRFALADSGHFWLSDTPEEIGSRGWDADLPRIATWVLLKFRSNPLNEVYVVNTHFDHRGEQARLESARLIRRLTDSLSGRPILVIGDFNCAPGSAPHAVLTEDTGNNAHLRDTYVVLGYEERGAGTYHAFRGDVSGPRIDWILCNRRFDVLESRILRTAYDGRYPSDHFPVTAVVQILPVTAWGAM